MTEGSARVDFRLGGDTADVYVAGLTVTEGGEEVRVDGGSGLEHFVSYRWNSRGCRSQEYPIPAAPGTFRILVLGDSHAMGHGVHAEDVFSAVMEADLRQRAAEARDPTRFEVVNCAVPGYSTREERLYYQARARAYRPDLVLLVMVADDDRRSADDLVPEVARPPARWEHLLSTAYLLRSILHEPPDPDFTEATAELKILRELTYADGSELALVVFTNGTGPAWNELWQGASAAAEALGVPILDLRDRLASGGSDDLRVHPIDGHSNEVAHRVAGEAIRVWAEREGLLPSPSASLNDTGHAGGS
jgi:hypothetical protein